MVFAFAGLSTITKFLCHGAGHLSDAHCAILLVMAPRPSPMYLAIAGLSWPLLYGLFRLRARGREHLPQGGFVLAAESQLELRSVAARGDALSEALPALHGRSRSSSGPAQAVRHRGGRVSGAPRAGRPRGDRDGDSALPRGAHRRHVPGGHPAQEGAAEEVRGAGAHRRGADRARRGRAARPGRDRRHRPARAPRAAPGGLRPADPARRPRRPRRTRRRSRPSG